MQQDSLGAIAGGIAAWGTLLVLFLVWLAAILVVVAGMWKVFTKAGKPGWACLIPIYNALLLLEIAGRPGWWFLLFLVPLLNIVIAFVMCIDLAKSFGQSTGFGIGLALLSPIFFCILGFGSSRYLGPAAQNPRPAVA